MRLAVAALGIVLLATFGACKGSDGTNGTNGTSCTVTDNGDGTVTISCDDGTNVTVTDGTDGSSCTVTDNGDGTKTIACDDGTTVVVGDGQDGQSCTVTDNGNGTKTISCEDGTTVVVSNGDPGDPATGNFHITSFHGGDYLAERDLIEHDKYLVDSEITSVTADAAGLVTVNFTVATKDGDPVVDVPSISANIAKLVAPATGESFNKWVAYIYRTETTSGLASCTKDCWPNPDGTVRYQAYRESNGTLNNHGDGSYTYVFATNLSAVTTPVAVSYQRNLLHRVSIMMGGHSGATSTAYKDFVPDGSTVTASRNVVQTAACQACHGSEFAGHGGDRLLVENCATCHVPGNEDAQGGNTVDLKVMIHKIHMGGESPTIAGPDGNPWLTADNGEWAIWGYQNTKHTWEKVGFPALPDNCTKCHDGASDAANYKNVPSRDACGSCHDDIDFTQTNNTAPDYHPGGNQTDDDSCMVCHGPTKTYAVDKVHDFANRDPRNVPEFTLAVTMTAPTNGTYYTGDEAPVVTVVISEDGNPIDHNLVQGSAVGCTPTGDPPTCAARSDGKFATANFFVHGPRARHMPVLTTVARSEVLSPTTGPWDLTAGDTLVVKMDQGQTLILDDAQGTQVPGMATITVPTTASYTADDIVTWLNGNAAFYARALAYNEGGKVGVRSRNLGSVYSLQLLSSNVATTVFGGDILPHSPGGFYPNNKLALQTSGNDPKVTRYSDRIEYQLDPVTDLEPGTYIVGLEISRNGRVNDSNYLTPSVLKFPFQVGTATDEPKPAGNCDRCHENAAGAGFVLDYPRHNKIFDDTAIDQCGNCHDYQPQSVPGQSGFPTNGSWPGAKPISKRVHSVHFGSELNYPVATVDHADTIAGRDWFIEYPQDVRNCETCHPDGETSGSWAAKPARIPCMGCHDATETWTHMKLMTWDPTPADPWSGDEEESCKVCH